MGVGGRRAGAAWVRIPPGRPSRAVVAAWSEMWRGRGIRPRVRGSRERVGLDRAGSCRGWEAREAGPGGGNGRERYRELRTEGSWSRVVTGPCSVLSLTARRGSELPSLPSPHTVPGGRLTGSNASCRDQCCLEDASGSRGSDAGTEKPHPGQAQRRAARFPEVPGHRPSLLPLRVLAGGFVRCPGERTPAWPSGSPGETALLPTHWPVAPPRTQHSQGQLSP